MREIKLPPSLVGDEPAAGSIALARPKSNTFTVPSLRTLMFEGLRSRAAFADLGGDVVDAESGAGSECQIWRNYMGGTAVLKDYSCNTARR